MMDSRNVVEMAATKSSNGEVIPLEAMIEDLNAKNRAITNAIRSRNELLAEIDTRKAEILKSYEGMVYSQFEFESDNLSAYSARNETKEATNSGYAEEIDATYRGRKG